MTHCAPHTVGCSPRVHPLSAAIVLLCSLALYAGCGGDSSSRFRAIREQTEAARELYHQGRYLQSLELLKDGLAAKPEPGLDSVLAESHFLAAQCQERLGRYELALADYTTSMQYARDASDQRFERLNKVGLARFYLATGDVSIAARLASEAAASARVFWDSTMMLDALRISAEAEGRSGEADRALSTIDHLDRSMDPAARKDRQPMLMKLRFMALLRAGRDAEVRELLARWKAAYKGAADRRGAMTALVCAGIFQERLSHPDSALASYSAALTMLDASTDPFAAKELFTRLGNVAYQLRHFADARRYYDDALGWAAGDGAAAPLLGLAIAACDWNIGRRQTDPAPLISACGRILEKSREQRFARGEALAHFMLGMFAEHKGDPARALASYESARAIAQGLIDRSADAAAWLRIAEVIMEGEQSGWFKASVRLRAEADDARSVFEGIERETLDDIGNFFLESSLHPAEDAVRVSLDQFRWRCRLAARCEREIEEELALGSKGNPERAAALAEAYAALKQEAGRAAKELNSVPSNFRWIVSERELALGAVRDTMSPGTALLEYAVLPKSLVIIVVTKDTVLMRNVAADRTSLLATISEYNRIVADVKVGADGSTIRSAAAVRRTADLASILSEALLEPVAAELARADTLFFVPPAEFGWLPFHTLRAPSGSGRGYEGSAFSVMERWNVRYLPTAAMLFCASVPERYVRTVTGFGHPGTTNWDAEYELKDIRSFYEKARMHFDTAATIARLTRINADVLQIAAEFTLSPSGPDRLSIVLSDGVRTTSIARVPIGALAAMPPPQTLFVSNISAAPGGLSRYAPAMFLAGGAKTVIVTMWRGDRKAKRYFGEIFYTNLTTGLPSGESFRSAVLAMQKKFDYAAEQRWGLYFQFGR